MDVRRIVEVLSMSFPDATSEQMECAVVDLAASFERCDITSVTLGVSLLDCSSRLPSTVRARVYDKIRRVAAPLGRVMSDAEDRFGAIVSGRRIAVTPIALVHAGGTVSDFVSIGEILDRVAMDTGADSLAGFSAIVDGGMSEGDRTLIDSIPAVLVTTNRVLCSVTCGSTRAGTNHAAVLSVAEAIHDTASRADSDVKRCTRLVCRHDAPGTRDSAEHAFHDISSAECDVNLEVSLAGSVASAVANLGQGAHPDAIAETVSWIAAASLRRAGAIGRACAHELSQASGVPVSYGVTTIRGLDTDRFTLKAVIALAGDSSAETIASVLVDELASAAQCGRTSDVRIVPVRGKNVGDSVDLGGPFGTVRVVQSGPE